jgi:REP element-mobilizing transposase RayT
MNRHAHVGQTSGLPVAGTSGSPSDQPSPLVSGLHSRGALPHLKREGATYFVTFRLAGTLPREVLLQLKREREAMLEEALAHNRPLTWHEQKELFDWYAQRVDKYLDAGHGDCWLRRPEVAGLVATALRYFDGQRYDLHAWVVMPNHVHTVVHPTPPHTLSAILKSWKTYTAVHANRLLHRAGRPFWQSESYDHCCRDDEDRTRCCVYTSMNPVTAGLCACPEDWLWSHAHVGQTSGLPVAGTSGSPESTGRFAR